ncbi:MAG: zinc ABC transporter substrate-binding protein [Candidatus Lokiarchaeota archaeon]|nr:zinc ABC transporter substrate-binding protein [Candidatus Lokiarchaeota archaeon]
MQKNKKFTYSTLVLIGILSACFAGCIDDTSPDSIGVLVTIVPQAEMVEYIGGEYVDVTIMVPVGESPHSFEPTPEQMIKVAQATAYFKVGSGVEFEIAHMDTILEQNSDLRVFDGSDEITVVSFDEHYGKETHHDDEEEHDHDHSGTDPHIWTSPVNFKKMAEVVYNGLIDIDPDHQEDYYNNYQKYISMLEDLHKNVSNLLKPYEGKSFMVYHPAWGYFGDTYNLKMIAIEDEGKQPGPTGIAAIITQAKDENITVIFVAPQFDTSSAETIADEIDGNVVFANPLMSNYIETITKLAEDMVSGFE